MSDDGLVAVPDPRSQDSYTEEMEIWGPEPVPILKPTPEIRRFTRHLRSQTIHMEPIAFYEVDLSRIDPATLERLERLGSRGKILLKADKWLIQNSWPEPGEGEDECQTTD